MNLLKIRERIRKGLAAFRLSMFYVRAEGRDIADTYLLTKKRKRLTPWGFVLVGGSSQHHLAMQQGSFEPEETRLFIDCLRETDVFVDVGANIGYYSAIARHSKKHVICVEPLAANLEFLYATFAENKWNDVEVFPMGAGESPSIARLYGASGTGASLLQNWAGASRTFRRVIPLTTIDILLAGRLERERIFIKIDVEGLEYEALLGAQKTLGMAPKPTWMVEITLNEYHPQGMNPHYLQIFELFWKHGYIATTADARRRTVNRGDVEKWTLQGNSDSGVINYVFSAAS